MYIEATNIAAIDLSSFRSNLQAGLDSCTTLSAEQLHRLLQNLLDQHAPAKQRKVSNHPLSPWFCAVGPQLPEAKRERRRAERLSLKSRLEMHKQIFPFRLQTRQQNSATRKCIVQHQDLSSKQLFSITNTLLSKSNTSSQPFYSIRTSAAVFVTSL